ncbi:MAG TPA: cytochrome c family protein [Sphingobium sp.]|nr:cytochrome c family protein [Sphingobium sp.]
MALAAPAQAQLPKGDAARGQTLFNQCKVCHSLDAGKNGLGPSLKGIVGTKAADVPGFKFSPAMQKSNLTWTPATLSDFLTAPMKKVPGTKMAFAGLSKPQDRADIIAFLAKN